jgi:hypothetical protein
MKSLLKFIIAAFCVLSHGAFAQSGSGDDILTWNASRKLTWEDYKAKPDPGSDAAASTTTLLLIDYKISNTSFSYKIKSHFSKNRSWGRHKDAYILSHEQGHFDIAEIFARKLHKLMSEYRFDLKTYQKELKKIYEKVTDEKEEMQNEYDQETRHSINREKQAAWLKKIALLLTEYESYSGY